MLVEDDSTYSLPSFINIKLHVFYPIFSASLQSTKSFCSSSIRVASIGNGARNFSFERLHAFSHIYLAISHVRYHIRSRD